MVRPILPLLLLAACGEAPAWPEPTVPWRMVLTREVDGNLTASAVLEPDDPDAGDLAILGLRANGASPWTATAPTSGGCGPRGPCDARRATLDVPVPNGVLAVAGVATPFPLRPPTMVQAELVGSALLRVTELAWRALDLPPGVFPAEGEPDPTRTELRSVIKVPRDLAPPVYVASAEAGCLAVVALLDHKARDVLAWDHLRLPGPTCAPFALVPPTDLDGDGTVDVVAYSGNGTPGTGAWRGVWSLHTKAPDYRLERRWSRSIPGECFGP